MSSEVYDYNTVPASNDAAVPLGAPEGHTPQNVNNIQRQVMAALANMVREFPWLDIAKPEVLAKGSATTFTVTSADSVDYTPWFTANRTLKLVGTSTTVYMKVVSSAYAADVTTVTVAVITAGDVVPAGISEASLSLIDDNAGLQRSAALAPSVSDARVGANLWYDGSFTVGNLNNLNEVDQGGAWSISAVDPKTGTNHARYNTAGQAGNAYLYANSFDVTAPLGQIAAAEGAQFSIGAQIQVNSSVSASVVQLGISWRNEAGGEISDTAGAVFEPGTSYGSHSASVVAPAGAIYGVPYLRVNTGGPSRIYDFDEVHVERTDLLAPGGRPLASAATVTLPSDGEWFLLTGTTDISTLTASFAGRRVTFTFDRGAHTRPAQIAFNDNSPSDDSANRTVGSWIDDGFQAGETATVDTPSGVNDGDYLIESVTALALTFDSGVALTNEVAAEYRHVSTPGLSVLDTGNIRLGGSFAALKRDTLTLECDGTNWHEVGRNQAALRRAITSTATLTLPAWRAQPDLFMFGGSTDTTSMIATALDVGRVVVLQGDPTVAADIIDGVNPRLTGNWAPGFRHNLTLICDGTVWFELARNIT